MNNIILIGRLVREPELKFVAGSGKAVAKFSLAVDREFSKEKKTDFFNCEVWGKTAENVANYLVKGSQVAIRGSVQNNNYEKDGKTVYGTKIVAERVEFLSKKSETGNEPTSKSNDEYDFSKFETVESDAPF